MIDIKEAILIAKKEFPNYKIIKCIDIEKSFAFSFCNDNGEILPGFPIVCVNKQSGKVEYMTIPPLENIDILDRGKIINLIFEQRIDQK